MMLPTVRTSSWQLRRTPQTIKQYLETFKASVLSKNQGDESVMVCGWVRRLRKHKSVVFIDIHDGSQVSDIQLVIDPLIMNSAR